jgi:hypothetical protein
VGYLDGGKSDCSIVIPCNNFFNTVGIIAFTFENPEAFPKHMQKSNSVPEQGMLEGKHHKQLEQQAEAFDGCSHKFHMQGMQPTMQDLLVNKQQCIVDQ